mgnify:FL=1
MGKKFFEEIELFLFDMDGLLFDTETIYVGYGREVAKKMGYTITKDIVEKTTGVTNDKARILFKESLGQDFPYDEMMGTVKDHILELAKKSEVPLKSGALELLEFLRENNKEMILATSSDLFMAEALINGKDLKKYFSYFVTAEDVVHGKPDPEVFLIGAKKAGVSPKKTAVFEDSFNGIRAAHAAGTFPIMVPDKLKPTEEIEKLVYKKFNSLVEVLDYFKGND